MSANNKFVVDLGKLELTDEQTKNMNAAIQKAVVGELGKIKLPKDVIFLPGYPTKKPGFIHGILVREFAPAYKGIAEELGEGLL